MSDDAVVIANDRFNHEPTGTIKPLQLKSVLKNPLEKHQRPVFKSCKNVNKKKRKMLIKHLSSSKYKKVKLSSSRPSKPKPSKSDDSKINVNRPKLVRQRAPSMKAIESLLSCDLMKTRRRKQVVQLMDVQNELPMEERMVRKRFRNSTSTSSSKKQKNVLTVVICTFVNKFVILYIKICFI